jgi:alpha-L-fucosidase 2
LFDSGPPFQIDGNFGAAAGIAEMLLQSHLGEIHILPALPSSWPTGKVMGLCARGGFEVDIAWQEGKMIRASVHSKLGKTCRIRTERVSQVTANGKFVEISNPGKNLVEFKTQAGYTYQILAGE